MDARPVPRQHRVAIYARTSTAREQNPAMQLDELRRMAEQRGWTIVGEYVDRGVSGAKDRRPELDRLMADVRRGGANAPGIVAVWRFDRFARSVRHLVNALDEFNTRGVEFVSLQDGIDTSTHVGRFTFHIVAAVAQLERELIRGRVQAGVDAARRRGARLGRPRVRIDLDRARALLAEPGASVRKVARALGCGASTLAKALKGEAADAATLLSANQPCEVECGQTSTCQQMNVECPTGPTSLCEVDCGGTSSCQGGRQNCSAGPCVAKCTGESSQVLTLGCETASACDDECPL